jgi:NAD(P)-dependent dehydrogenase (short-subunit alcohol dehydrogenase family)
MGLRACRLRRLEVDVAQVDALDDQAVERHLATVDQAGGIDISFSAIGIPQESIQGILLVELTVESFGLPIATYTRSHFLTARAAAKRMMRKGSAVVAWLRRLLAWRELFEEGFGHRAQRGALRRYVQGLLSDSR